MLISSINKNLDVYDESYMKIKFISDDESPLSKTITIAVSAIFLQNK